MASTTHDIASEIQMHEMVHHGIDHIWPVSKDEILKIRVKMANYLANPSDDPEKLWAICHDGYYTLESFRSMK